MILVDIYVPSVDAVYDFQLDENTPVRAVTTENSRCRCSLAHSASCSAPLNRKPFFQAKRHCLCAGSGTEAGFCWCNVHFIPENLHFVRICSFLMPGRYNGINKERKHTMFEIDLRILQKMTDELQNCERRLKAQEQGPGEDLRFLRAEREPERGSF